MTPNEATAVPAGPPPGPPADPTPPAGPVPSPRGWWLALAVLGLVGIGGAALAWQSHQRLVSLEQELVRRQQASDALATEARLLASQSQDASRDAVARVALLDARVTEAAAQRSQVEDLLLSLSRARDENVLADLEAAVRQAQQHTALTGSAQPLLAALKQADERLARLNQPRLERVRRAVARDLERVAAAGATDIATLTLRLDDVLRQVDELPLLALPEPRRSSGTRRDAAGGGGAGTAPALPASGAASVASAASAPDDRWYSRLPAASRELAGRVWDEARSLLRVTRIDNPEALLLAPDHAFFVRENVKLRLLNARLALLSRQFDVAQADLRDAQSALDRYFDRQSRRVQGAAELLRQVTQQSRNIGVPYPDDTLAALSAAAAAR